MHIGRSPVRRAIALLATLALIGVVLVGVAATPANAAAPDYWVSKIQLTKVWKITRGAGVTVAVVDSGTPPTKDLGRRLLSGRNLVTGSGTGRIDSGEYTGGGGNFSHGENMAELIAGTGSGGLTGVAPQAKILPVKIATTGDSTFSAAIIARGIRYAVQHGAQVINLSLGGTAACSPAEAAASKYAYQHDVIVVAATGNDGTDVVGDPADCPGVLAVAGLTADARVWSGSDYGRQIDLANFATGITESTLSGYRAKISGTSPATAITSGEIALLRAKFPKDSARAIVTRLLWGIDNLTTTVKNGTRVNDHVGYGIPVPLDALRDTVPSYAPNPIYDELAEQLGPGSGNPASPAHGGSTSPSTTSPSMSAPSTSAPSTSAASSGGGTGAGVYIGAAALLIVIIGIGIAVARARRRLRSTPPRYGPPGNYGPPPPGSGQ